MSCPGYRIDAAIALDSSFWYGSQQVFSGTKLGGFGGVGRPTCFHVGQAIALAYFMKCRSPASPFEANDVLNQNGSPKTKDELEMEKLYEPVLALVYRYLRQTTTPTNSWR
jgi:hypothetical protein